MVENVINHIRENDGSQQDRDLDLKLTVEYFKTDTTDEIKISSKGVNGNIIGKGQLGIGEYPMFTEIMKCLEKFFKVF